MPGAVQAVQEMTREDVAGEKKHFIKVQIEPSQRYAFKQALQSQQ